VKLKPISPKDSTTSEWPTISSPPKQFRLKVWATTRQSLLKSTVQLSNIALALIAFKVSQNQAKVDTFLKLELIVNGNDISMNNATKKQFVDELLKEVEIDFKKQLKIKLEGKNKEK